MNRKAMGLVMCLITTVTVSAFAFGGSFHSDHGYMMGRHGHHGMMFENLSTELALTAEQQSLLAQLETSQQMIEDMMTNIRANSIDANGEFDRSMMREQMVANEVMLENHKDDMQAFTDSLSEEQKDAWRNLIKSNKKNCQDK